MFGNGSSRKPSQQPLQLAPRDKLVSSSHEMGRPQSWRTLKGEKVRDSSDTHTLKFNGWYKAVHETGLPVEKTLGHMTVKWGRGNNAVYSDYRGGKDQPEKVKLQPPIVDKRDQKVISEHAPKELDSRTHTPSQHAKSLVGRVNDGNDKFRHNARYAMRVKVSTEELQAVHSELSQMERQGNYGLFKEMDSPQKRMVRCMTPIEALAKVKDPQFKFSEQAIHPHEYMAEFAARFPESTSRQHFREYSGASFGELESPKQRQRIDPSSQIKRPRRPFVSLED